MALTEDVIRRERGNSRYHRYPVAAAADIFKGAVVAVNAAGFLVPASDTAAERVVGVATARLDNTEGAAGDGFVIATRTIVQIPTSGASVLDQTDVGRDAFVLDDNTAVKAAGTTNNIIAGEVTEFEPGFVWIQFGRPR